MSTTTTVIVRDPVNTRDLFDAARTVVGNPEIWHLDPGSLGSEGVHMYKTQSDQGAKAVISVHFVADGVLLPPAQLSEPSEPGGYAHVTFDGAGGGTADVVRARHASLAAELGRWLDAHHVGWCWSFEDDPWADGRTLTGER